MSHAYIEELDINDIPQNNPAVQVLAKSALESLEKCIDKGTIQAFLSMLLLNQVTQDAMTSMTDLICKLTQLQAKTSNDELDALANKPDSPMKQIETLLQELKEGKKDGKDLTDDDKLNIRSDISRLNNVYSDTKMQFETTIQQLQTDLQGLSQKEQGMQESGKLFLQTAQDISDFISYIAMLLR